MKAIKDIHPFLREFVIDARSGVILEICKYNAYGKTLFRRSLGNVDFSSGVTDAPELFESPNFIDYTVETTRQFMKLLERDKGKPSIRQLQERTHPHRESFWSHLMRTLNFTGTTWKIVFLLIGVISLGVAWWMRRHYE